MKTSYSPKPFNRVDYYALPNGFADVFLHKNERIVEYEEIGLQYVADEVYFQISQEITKEYIEDNFDYMWNDAEKDSLKPNFKGFGLMTTSEETLWDYISVYLSKAKSTILAMRLTSESADNEEQSQMYIQAKDEEGNIIEARSLPNNVKDEFKLIDKKVIKNIGHKTDVSSGTIINYADMADGGQYYARNDNGETETGVKGDTLGIDATKLTYQLDTPQIIENVQVKYFENGVQSGGLSCFGPNTTVMQEPVVTVETKPNEYNQIQLPTDKGLVELVGCYKDNGVTMVDCLEDATLDTGTGIVTINGADITKDYFVAATIDKSNTTLGTIGMRYPV